VVLPAGPQRDAGVRDRRAARPAAAHGSDDDLVDVEHDHVDTVADDDHHAAVIDHDHDAADDDVDDRADDDGSRYDDESVTA
jgi:hypothetical protein